MPRGWPRLVLAFVAAFLLATAGTMTFAARATAEPEAKKPAKKTAKTKTAKKPSAEESDEAKDQHKRKNQDPAEAAKAIEAAHKMLEGGKAETAVLSLSGTLQGGNLPPGLMARALLYRGMGYRQTQKPALAIADLTQALWLKGGLGEAERAEAQRQRAAAYADAGLSDSGAAVAATPPGAVRTASNSSSVTTGSNAASDAAPASSGGNWNLFGGLFGNQSSSQPSAPAPASRPAPTPRPAQPASSSWSSTTQVHAPSVVAAATPTAPVPTAPPPSAAGVPEGKFQLQLGLVRTQQEAGVIAGRVRGELAPIFEAREASVDQAVVGNFGTMYRVRVGPYASANEGRDVCGRLKGRGLDCRVVTD